MARHLFDGRSEIGVFKLRMTALTTPAQSLECWVADPTHLDL